MKNLGFATIAATALTAGFLGLAAPALAAPTGAGNAQDTISSLQQQGYKVIVNRLSNAPLAQASVVSIGEGASFSHTDQNAKNNQSYTGYDRQFAPKTTKTVYVNVK
ncbi:hypothetical protein [Mycolicibacterium mengxianglii]|uniref:hypothetical protein n=1 Tax=Mycolicibacterium mengxianglii TaxID=2736649 RepID=UPI001E587E0C|nr:hypothetical protein [Mycolicibacterium mengxianglii]